ncbi:MAG: hypothetical protein IKJ69_06610 [Clostridia bacterium]|nr:hypothetical protein [Clostridia bacterium]
MSKEKTQLQRIFDVYVTVIVLITAVMLVVCGVAISKVNTDYMQTGIRAGKIVAERENMQISVTTHEGIELKADKNYLEIADKVLSFLPPPVNTTYLMTKELMEWFDSQN